jgi:Myosin head (motor domain)
MTSNMRGNDNYSCPLAAATSHHVYIKDVDSLWIPGRLIESGNNNKTALVEVTRTVGKTSRREQVAVKLEEYPNQALPPQNLNRDGSPLIVADMVDLPFLHEVSLLLPHEESSRLVVFLFRISHTAAGAQKMQYYQAAILYNLKARHQISQPYTSTGSILVAVNPYQWIQSLYTEERMVEYSQKLVWERASTLSRNNNNTTTTTTTAVAPHVYQVSSKAYKGLARDQQDQSILVSGESGAGKTETVKICLHHIASVQRGPGVDITTSSPIVQRILESNPLL